MNDWKGNEIKAGMTIVFIQTRIDYPKSGLFIPGKGVVWMQEASSESTWEVMDEFEVQQFDRGLGYIYTVNDGEYSFSTVIIFDEPVLGMGHEPGNGVIIAIKGISDHNDISTATNDLINKALGK